MDNKKILSEFTETDLFWLDDISILFNTNRMIEFFPTSDMTFNEQLNALTRLIIYISIIIFLYTYNTLSIYIGTIFLLLIYIVYLFKDNINIKTENYKDILNKVGADPNNNDKQNTGLINSYEYDNDGNLCQGPTKNNPFMNILSTDYKDQPNRPPACPIDMDNIKKKIDDNFYTNLFRDPNDIWNNRNSQYQYYTTPSTTIPNDRETFMNWCYRPPYVCKDGDQNACFKNYNDPFIQSKL